MRPTGVYIYIYSGSLRQPEYMQMHRLGFRSLQLDRAKPKTDPDQCVCMDIPRSHIAFLETFLVAILVALFVLRKPCHAVLEPTPIPRRSMSSSISTPTAAFAEYRCRDRKGHWCRNSATSPSTRHASRRGTPSASGAPAEPFGGDQFYSGPFQTLQGTSLGVGSRVGHETPHQRPLVKFETGPNTIGFPNSSQSQTMSPSSLIRLLGITVPADIAGEHRGAGVGVRARVPRRLRKWCGPAIFRQEPHGW